MPCNGCVACCKREAIMLFPERGDKIEDYETVPMWLPNVGKELFGGDRVRLKQKENGECLYLGESGCTIWDKAPVICREFDCRKFLRVAHERNAD